MGFHRVHLRADDGDHLTVYVPLTEDGYVDPGGHRPWLLKALWGGFSYVGELELGGGALNRVTWGSGDAPSMTDFGTARVVRGALIMIHDTDSNSQKHTFVVIDVQRV